MRCIRPLLFVSLLAAIAFTQSNSPIGDGVHEGSPSILLSNGKLSLAILKQGATFGSISTSDDESKLNPLWNPVRMARELGNSAQPTSNSGHFVCVDGFGGTSAEERAAGLPNHGEARLVEMDVKSSRNGNVTEATFAGILTITQEKFTRTVKMVDGESVVYVESKLDNLLGFDRPVVWAEHATVGSPFLESGVTVFDLSGTQSQTRTFPNANQRRLAPGKDFSWPVAPGLDGSPIDMRATPANPRYTDHVTTKVDPSKPLGWTTALNPKLRLMIGWIFKREEFPWIQTWGNYPATGKMARGMEFSTQPYDVPRRQAITMGSLFDTPTFRWLPAKSSIGSRFLIFLVRVPEGMQGVDDVRLESGQITVVDRKSAKQVTIAASLGL